MLIVFGSLNMDMVFRLDTLPKAGETALADTYEMSPGGKGANQALAAARSGARTALVGMRGNDQTGKGMTIRLRRDGVMTTGVGESALPTGYAIVMIDKQGQNQIIVTSGANVETRSDQVPDEILTPTNFLLMQMEVPIKECADLLERAKAQGTTTILNLAPALQITQQMLNNLDYLIVNQVEALQFAKILNIDVDSNPTKLAEAFSKMGDLTCIITLGDKGSFALTKEGGRIQIPALKLEQEEIVDCTGAGDAYSGTLAACLHAGMDFEKALRRASVAGSLACTKFGAQLSFPYIAEIEEHLENLGD